MNPTKVIIDTNILVYAWNSEENEKKDKAIACLQRYQGHAFLSIQNISEFTAVMIRSGVSLYWIKETISIYERLFTIVHMNSSHVKEAIRAVEQYQMSFWDAQIWAVAKSYSIPLILTEDGPSGQIIEGVSYLNPL